MRRKEVSSDNVTGNSSLKLFFVLSLIIGFYATVTNIIPISVLPFAVAAIYYPFIGFRKSSDSIHSSVLLLFIYASINLITYDPSSFVTPLFYRYDGNFFAVFTPLLLIGALTIKTNPDKLFLRFCIFVSIINIPVIALAILYGTATNGFFFANNAYGGFSMFPFLIAFLWYWNRKHLLAFIILGIAFIALLTSYSRGSWLGVFGALIAFYSYKKDRMWVLYSAIAALILIEASILYFTYPIYLELQNAFAYASETGGTTKSANLYIRAFDTWPRALHLFLHAPIFGMGTGAVNDVPFVLEGTWPFMTNSPQEFIHSDSHAHQSFIHILGEWGIVGLFIFLVFLRSIFKYLKSQTYFLFSRDLLRLSLWSLIFASFTENRLTTPSNAFPFVLALLFYSCAVAYQKKKEAKE